MTTQPQTLGQLFPSPWLKADDLHGRIVEVTIIAVTLQEFASNPMNQNSDKIWKAVLDFGRSKNLILNKTQATAVSEIAGTETLTAWRGTRITLRPAIAKNGKATINITTASPLPEIKADANEIFFKQE